MYNTYVYLNIELQYQSLPLYDMLFVSVVSDAESAFAPATIN
jgi:hypothetical protein